MNLFNSFRGKACALLVLCSVALSASASTFLITDDELHPEVFPAVAESIRANLQGPNAPRKLSNAERRDVQNSLARMEALIAENPRENHRRIQNLQVRLNAALAPRVATNDSRSDVVCQRIRKVGTNIPTTECKTRAQRELDEYVAEEELARLKQVQSLR